MVTFALRNILWLIIYLFFILAPLFVLLFGSLPPPRDVWTELSIALGYAGLAIMGLQFGLTARFRWVTKPWGEDVIYHFHRRISLIALGLVMAHPLILFVARPELLALLNFIQAPWRARLAAISTYSLITLIIMALWRVKLKLSYEVWHLTHIILAVAAVVAGILHMAAWGVYLVDPIKRALWCGLTLFWMTLLPYVRIVKPLFMLRTFADRRDQRPVVLIYGSKNWESITFREELDALQGRLFLKLVHVLASPHDNWTGEKGFINGELFKRHLPPPFDMHEYFICGPNVMMAAIENALTEMEVPMSKYHTERYNFA